jgi:hypothetical protein
MMRTTDGAATGRRLLQTAAILASLVTAWATPVSADAPVLPDKAATTQATPLAKPGERVRLTVAPSASRADSVVFTWRGRIEGGMADAIAQAFEVHKATTTRILLTIDSGGGSVAEGRRVIAVLERIKLTHDLDTYVKAGSTCGSMCVPIYLQGEKRYAAPSSLWLFHEVSIRNHTTKQITKLDRSAFLKLVDDYFVPAGVSSDWIADMVPKTEGSDYWRTGDALLREKSNIIHHAAADTAKRMVVDTAAGASSGASAR